MKKIWLISESENEFNDIYEFDKKQEAIRFGREEYKDEDFESFFVGEKVKYKINDNFLDSQLIIENLEESIIEDFCGSDIEIEIKATDKQMKELDTELKKILHTWLDKHKLRPAIFSVINIEPVEITTKKKKLRFQ